MPLNNNLKPKEFPMPIRFGEKPVTQFTNNLMNIGVELINAPTMRQLMTSCIPFANATWLDNPMKVESYYSTKEKELIMFHIFSGKILPTTMETIRVNFLIKGITIQEVTHILRYRRAVFSAECSGDKWWTHKTMVIPTAVQQSPEFVERYMKICEDAKQLYCDMIDSKEINIHDARYILPRAADTYYFMDMSLKDAITFIYDRVDKQIQPQSDNVIAYQMMTELITKYPMLVKVFGLNFLHQPSKFFIKTARQHRSTNWYCPDKDSDVFEYNEKDFVYGLKKRDEFLGTGQEKEDVFAKLLHYTESTIEMYNEMVDNEYGVGFFDQDIPMLVEE